MAGITDALKQRSQCMDAALFLPVWTRIYACLLMWFVHAQAQEFVIRFPVTGLYWVLIIFSHRDKINR